MASISKTIGYLRVSTIDQDPDRKIGVYAVKGDWELANNMQSTIMAMVFSIAAEIEHDLISQRTR